MFEILMFDIPLAENTAQESKKDLKVSFTFKETNVKETVIFKSFEIFKWIADEVVVSSWTIREVNGDVIEYITEGTTINQLIDYIKKENFVFQ